MQVHGIQNNNHNTNFQGSVNTKAPFFGPVKNTFERQISIAKADYLEAKARLHYMNFRKNEDALSKIESPLTTVTETLRLIKTVSSMAYHKWQSVNYISKSHFYRHKYDRKLLRTNF